MTKTNDGYVLTDFCSTLEELEELVFWYVLNHGELQDTLIVEEGD